MVHWPPVMPVDAPHTATIEDDATLARRVASAPPGGAREAEGELYRRLAARVRLYGLRHLRDPHAAADLAQDVLLLTFESLRSGRVRDPERLASFVLGACRMVVADLRRGAERRQRLLQQFGGDLTVAPSAPDHEGDSRRLQECLGGLAERDRTVLVMAFYADRSSGEIATELGLSPGNVRVIRHRAIERLRRCMGGGGAT